jgi:hypothetical protein
MACTRVMMDEAQIAARRADPCHSHARAMELRSGGQKDEPIIALGNLREPRQT